ncbi:hypothetical protein MOK15_17920 [Sphingobium sp. BYY-5]|nr:hypothetical protein [Sphingobium sp. BYY-5]MCI4591966.1 hypothetical protein [Sphingobium sp. BYY-5]
MTLDFGKLGFGAAAIGNLYQAIPDGDARSLRSSGGADAEQHQQQRADQ